MEIQRLDGPCICTDKIVNTGEQIYFSAVSKRQRVRLIDRFPKHHTKPKERLKANMHRKQKWVKETALFLSCPFSRRYPSYCIIWPVIGIGSSTWSFTSLQVDTFYHTNIKKAISILVSLI